MEKLLTVKELARLLGLNPALSITGYPSNDCRGIRFSRRCVRFRESDVQSLLETLRQPAAKGSENK
jgi:hypothetical protein